MPDHDPTSVPGDFYVESQCCMSCGVPQAVAPDLVGWIEADMRHCYWKKQPQTQEELRQAFAIFHGQELGCHRYAGNDPKIQARIGFENCDRPRLDARAATSSEDHAPQFLSTEGETWLHRLWAAIWHRR